MTAEATADRRWTLLFTGYFALQALLRPLIGLSLQYDEAEALYFARDLAWGYGPQPPLYFWLQWAAFQVVGEGLPALAILKNALLAAVPLLLYGYLRGEVAPGPAGAATLSLGLLPSLAWEAQRALTHSVLALALGVAALWLLARAQERGGWWDHLALGLCVGLGVLAKLNFPIWVAGLGLGALALPEWRGRLRAGRLGGAALLALTVTAPALAWMARNPDLATASVYKLGMGEVEGLAARASATGSLLARLAGVLALAAVALGLTWVLGGQGGRGAAVPPRVQLLAAASGLSLGLLWAGMLASGSTIVEERWLLPLAWGLVPVAVLWLWPRLGGRARRAVAGVSAGLWLVAMVGLPAASFWDVGYRRVDHAPLARRLEAAGAPGVPLVVTSVALAGNLVHVAPGLRPVALRDGAEVLPEGSALLLTQADNSLIGRADVQRRRLGVEAVTVPGRPGEDELVIVRLAAE